MRYVSLEAAKREAHTQAKLQKETMIVKTWLTNPGMIADRHDHEYEVISFTAWLKSCEQLGGPVAHAYTAHY